MLGRGKFLPFLSSSGWHKTDEQEEKYEFREFIEIGPKKLQGGQFLCLDKETIHLCGTDETNLSLGA